MDRTVEAEVPDAVLERGPRPDKKVEMYLALFSNCVTLRNDEYLKWYLK